MRDEHIRANGITLRCRVEGPSSAQALVFSNSLATDLSMWDAQASFFASRYRVIRYDARGHGESQATPAYYSLSTLVEDVRSLLDAVGIEQAHYVGLSLGGMVGQLFAARYPQRLVSLTLCDTAARMKREMWEDRIRLVEKEGIGPAVEPSIERWFTSPFRERNALLIEGVRQMIRKTSVDGYVGSAAAIMEMDNVNQLARIATPTLVLVGRHDPSTPLSEAEFLHEKIADSRLVVIEDAAHLPNIEQTNKFNEVLEEFLQRQNARVQEISLASQSADAGIPRAVDSRLRQDGRK